MGYNPNKKAGAPAAPTSGQPKREKEAPCKAEDYRRPVGKITLANGDKEFTDLASLFVAKTKNGKFYFKGKDQDGNKFQIFLNENPVFDFVELCK